MPKELGKYLESLRLEKGLSAGDLADTSRVNIRFIHAAEKGEFGDLPGDVFNKGLLRSYGTILGIDGDDLIRRYDVLDIEPRDRSPELISLPLHAEQAIPTAVIGSLFGGIALVVIVAVYYNFGDTTPIAQPPVKRVAADVVKKGEEKKPVAAEKVENEDSPQKALPSPSLAPTIAPLKKVKKVDRLADSTLPNQLTLTALSDAWIKVYVDEEDEEVEREIILRQGKTVHWWAAKSFRLSLGNVAGTTVKFNGKTINLGEPRSNILTNILFPPQPAPETSAETNNKQ